MSAFIVVLGGIFLAIAVAAVYILVQKKVISNPLDYISSMFSPGGTGGTGGLGGLGETGETGETGGTDEIYGTDETGGTYVDKFSPNKKVKGRYIWITRANANSTAYRNAFQGYYGMLTADTYHERAPISVTEITITGKNDEVLGQQLIETRYDENNYVSYLFPHADFKTLEVKWDGVQVEYCTGSGECPSEPQEPYSKGEKKQDGQTISWSTPDKYEITRTTKQEIPATDNSGTLASSDRDLLFNSDIDDEGNDQKGRFTSRGTTSTVDYIKLDLESVKTISNIKLDSLKDQMGDEYWMYNMLGVYVVVTKDDNMDRPVAITPIIKKVGTSHSFDFPGTEWTTDGQIIQYPV